MMQGGNLKSSPESEEERKTKKNPSTIRWIWCKNCGQRKEILVDEYSKIIDQKQRFCSNCGYIQYLNKKELICTMNQPYFTSEKDVHCLIFNALSKRGIPLWNCMSEPGKCPDPIFYRGIPIMPLTGDIPVFWKETYQIIEIKFSRRGCRFSKQRNLYVIGLDTPHIYEIQSKLMLKGRGLMIIVIEPSPSSILNHSITCPTKKLCETRLRQVPPTKVGGL